MLRFYAATANTGDSKKAMAECLEKAFADSTDKRCDILIIHSSIGHHFPDLIKEARRQYPDVQIAGATCAGVIGNEGANESVFALGIIAIQSDAPDELVIASCDNIRSDNSYEKSRGMAMELKDLNPEVNMMLFLASGIDIHANHAIAGIESVWGPEIDIFGGTSSDNMKAISAFQIHNTSILERGAVLIGFANSSLSMEMGVHHGSVPIGLPMEVTKSESNRIFTLDNEPAWTYLMKKLGLPDTMQPGPAIPVAGLAELLDEDLQEEYDNKHILRVIVKVDPEDKSFYMPVDCKEGTKLWITERDEDKIFNGLDRMIARLKERIGDRKIVAVFHTDCGARGRFLFEKKLKEDMVCRMRYPLIADKKIPWLGMYGFGEFTKLKGKNFFHNYTTSIYAILR